MGMALFAGGVLVVLGALLGWLPGLSEDAGFIEMAVAEAVGTKKTTALVVGLLSLVVTFFHTKKGGKGLGVAGLLLALVLLASTSTANASEIGMDNSMGYYLSFLGALVVLVGSIGGLLKFK